MIDDLAAVPGPGENRRAELWIAPAFWDIQLNGRWGISFSDPGLTVDQVGSIVRAQARSAHRGSVRP